MHLFQLLYILNTIEKTQKGMFIYAIGIKCLLIYKTNLCHKKYNFQETFYLHLSKRLSGGHLKIKQNAPLRKMTPFEENIYSLKTHKYYVGLGE